MRLARAAAWSLAAIAFLCGAAWARPIISLDGPWEHVFCDVARPPGSEVAWAPVVVPATMEWRPEGPHTIWLRRRFYVPSSWSGGHALLRLNGVKYSQKVFVNGREVGGRVGGFAPTQYEVTAALMPGGTNELAIQVKDWTALLPAEAKTETTEQLKGMLELPAGSTLTGVGIWDSVSLDLRPRVWVEDVAVTTSVRDSVIQVRVTVKNAGADDRRATITARISEGGGGPLFEPAEVSVLAGNEASLILRAEWPNPTLWWPQAPHLYKLVVGVRAGVMADATEVRFGFREFWAGDDVFYLNCVPVHLLAVAAQQVMCDQPPDALLAAVKAAGANAIRLGGEPWPEQWYDAADEAGLFVIADSALCDMAEYYAMQDPAFWSDARREVCATVAHLRNHPSIVVWGAESEMLASGSARAESGEQYVCELVEAVQASDATRPVMCGGEGDGGGAADIVSIYRPHELPRWNQWPETAYWMSGPVELDGYPGGCWRWDRRKPLYLDELLRPSPADVCAATVLCGEATYTNPDLHRTLAETKAREWQVIAAREAGVSAISAWGVDEIADPASPARLAMCRVYGPLAAFDLSANTRILAGKVAERSVAVFNDTASARKLDLTWRLTPKVGKWQVDGIQRIALPAGGRDRVQLTLALPPLNEERIEATFTLGLCEGGRLVFSESTDWEVFGGGPLLGRPQGAPSRIAVYDPRGDTARLLAEMGIVPVSVDVEEVGRALRGCRAAVIGKCALVADPSVPTGPMIAELLSYVRGGGTLLVFEQPRYPFALMPAAVTSHSATIAFARDAAHPTLRGLEERDLAHWLPDGVVSLMEVAKPGWGGFRAIVDSGGGSGLATAGLAEVQVGKGRMILCQLDVTAKYWVDPVATRLARNLLSYLGTRPPRTGRIGVILDPPAPMQLNALGVEYDRFTDRVADLCRPEYPAVIISDPQRVQGYAPGLRRYVKEGGRVVFHNVNPANQQVVTEITQVPFELGENIAGTIALTNRMGVAAGLSNEDLNWLEYDRTSGVLCGSPLVASYVVDLSAVEQAVVHTTPGVLAAVPYGKGLWVIDQVRWDLPGVHQSQAQRYLGTLLMNLGASFRDPTCTQVGSFLPVQGQ